MGRVFESDQEHAKSQGLVSVLVLAFRRPDKLYETLTALKVNGPGKVYIHIDGPRYGVAEDATAVAACLEVANQFIWECPSEIRLLPENGGLGLGVLKGINWFFEHETNGIILEEDVLIAPNSLFLAGLMLQEFAHDSEVGSVTLFNAVPERVQSQPESLLRFSKMPSSQYWGTWKDRWVQTIELSSITLQTNSRAELVGVGGERFAEFWVDSLGSAMADKQISWEHAWILTHWINNWKSIVSNKNFAVHNGFGATASNSNVRPSWYPTQFSEILDPYPVISHPALDSRADAWYFNQRFGLSRWKKIKRGVKKVVEAFRRMFPL
ncbi:hypothetical protein N9J11_01220 [Actinomycetota bacterium]|nr:hypothetical protein [Actinomycetota bacterium]